MHRDTALFLLLVLLFSLLLPPLGTVLLSHLLGSSAMFGLIQHVIFVCLTTLVPRFLELIWDLVWPSNKCFPFLPELDSPQWGTPRLLDMLGLCGRNLSLVFVPQIAVKNRQIGTELEALLGDGGATPAVLDNDVGTGTSPRVHPNIVAPGHCHAQIFVSSSIPSYQDDTTTWTHEFANVGGRRPEFGFAFSLFAHVAPLLVIVSVIVTFNGGLEFGCSGGSKQPLLDHRKASLID